MLEGGEGWLRAKDGSGWLKNGWGLHRDIFNKTIVTRWPGVKICQDTRHGPTTPHYPPATTWALPSYAAPWVENVGCFGCLSEIIGHSPFPPKKSTDGQWSNVVEFWSRKLILGFKRAHPEFGAKAIARDGKHPKLKGWQQRIPEKWEFHGGNSNSSTCHWKIQHVDGTCTYKDTWWWLYIAILMHIYSYMYG